MQKSDEGLRTFGQMGGAQDGSATKLDPIQAILVTTDITRCHCKYADAAQSVVVAEDLEH